LAAHLGCRNPKAEVRLWEFFPENAERLGRTRRHPHIPGFRLDKAVTVSSNLVETADQAELLIFVLPSEFVRDTAHRVGHLMRQGKPPATVSASKGIEPRTLMTMAEVIASELPDSPVYALSGPSFAQEVAKGVSTRMVLAGPGGSRAESLRRIFDGGPLRVSWSADRKGVELGGSLKNVVAIGCGILDGLRTGANTKAALITQGMSEMAELIASYGGGPKTAFGLTGLGDMIATGNSQESRNRALGERLGRGQGLQSALRAIPTVVEGVEAAQSARALARRAHLKAPLLEAIWRIVRRDGNPKLVLKALGF
jgi:glycerol-3-phosphate dehydrogenase (NAD(P)+)